MRFYTKQHPLYCGIDLHARTMYLCILNQNGEILVHRNMPAGPEPFLNAVAPYRADVVVCVACIFTWYWLADLCARAGMPFVLGHALYMKAIHGGKAKNDKIDAQKIAVLLRGGMLPQAYVYPAAMRATRDLLRRRMPLMRKRAELLTHVQQTNWQYNVPEIGKKIADKANRAGVAERFPEPAVQKSIAVDLALIDYDDQLLRDLELTIGQTAKQHDAPTLYLLHTVPGIGKILSRVLLSEMHDMARFPRVQDCVSYCRLVTCAKASAGKHEGTSARRSGMRTSRGPAPKRRSCSSATIQRVKSISTAERKNTGRAKPSRSWHICSPGRSITCCKGESRAISRPFSRVKGGK